MARTKQSRKATIVLRRRLYRVLKSRSASTKDISEYVNDAVEEALREDALDHEAYRKTRKERSIPLSEAERELKRDGLL